MWKDAPEPAIPEGPALFSDARGLWLAYEMAPGNGLYAVILFRGVIEYHLTSINDEGIGQNPYVGAGLKWYAFNELFNSVETNKWSSPWSICRHWVVTFKDHTLDVVARDCPGSQTRSLGWSTE